MSSRLVQLHVLIIVILCKFETLQHEKRYLKINTAYVHISRNIPYLKYKIRSRFSCEIHSITDDTLPTTRRPESADRTARAANFRRDLEAT